MANLGGGIFLGIFGLFWCSFVFFVDGMLTWQAVRQVRASSYATTTGTITHSELKVSHDSDGTSYSPEVSYRYTISGRQIDGKRIRYDESSLGAAYSKAIVDRYPTGKAVPVHYNAAAPQEAVLEQGLAFTNLAVVLFLTPFNAVAFVFSGGVLAWLRSKQLGRPILGVYFRDDVLGQTIRIYSSSPTLVAIAAAGGTGFLSIFGCLLLSMMIPLEFAVALGWIATLGVTVFAWWYARKKFTEIRRDALRSRIELRSPDGLSYSVAQEDLQPVRFSHRVSKDSDGDRVEKYPMNLPFFDPASQVQKELTLPEQTTAADAQQFATWLNGVLGVANF